MRLQKFGLLIVLIALSAGSFAQKTKKAKNDTNSGEIIVRIAEIEIHSNFVDKYVAILKEESEASVRFEPGVICIYPMFQKEHPTQVRLLEVYANKEAYESHLQTSHFKHYKETTLEMIKDLKLIDMEAIDAETMSKIFRKLN